MAAVVTEVDDHDDGRSDDENGVTDDRDDGGGEEEAEVRDDTSPFFHTQSPRPHCFIDLVLESIDVSASQSNCAARSAPVHNH